MNVLIICARRFNGHELYTVLDVLDEHGHEWEITSTDVIIQDMDTDEPFRIEMVHDKAFSGIVIVEGDKRDTELLWRDPTVQSVAEGANELGNVPVAALGMAVPALGPNLFGRKISVFPTFTARSMVEESGGTVTGYTATRYWTVVTGVHHQTTRWVMEQFCDILETGRMTVSEFNSEFKPDGRKPRPVDLIDKIRRLREAKESAQ